MTEPKVGQRIILNTLLRDGDFPGEIVEVGVADVCVVKLDCQESLVYYVLYFEEAPEVVHSSLWQCCFPEGLE